MKRGAQATRSSWPARIAFLCLLVAYVPALLAPAVGIFHDDGLYLVTAKALAEGEGYRILSLPVEIPQTKFPILFPSVLSLVWRIDPSFPENVPLLKLVPFAAMLAWCALAWALVRQEEGGGPTAAAVVLLTAASPWVLFLSTTLLSETLFAACCWGALLLLRRHEKRGGGAAELAAAALLSGAAVLTRSIGVALVAAGVLALAGRRRLADAAVFALLAGGLVAPWLLWARAQGVQIPAEAGYYASANYLEWNALWSFTWQDKLRIVGWNAIYAFLSPGWLMGIFSGRALGLAVLLGALTYGGFFAHLRRGLTVLHAFFLVYLGVLLVWAWPPPRFLAPLLPLLLLFAWVGLRRTLDALPLTGRTARRVAVALVATAGVWEAGALAGASLHAARTGTLWPARECADPWREFEAVVAWLKAHAEPDAVLAGNLDPTLYLYTGRKAIRPFEADPVRLYYRFEPDREPLGPARVLADRLAAARADYLVSRPSKCFLELPFLERQVAALKESHPEAFTELAIAGAGEARVYRVDWARLQEERAGGEGSRSEGARGSGLRGRLP